MPQIAVLAEKLIFLSKRAHNTEHIFDFPPKVKFSLKTAHNIEHVFEYVAQNEVIPSQKAIIIPSTFSTNSLSKRAYNTK